jgi:hypothetical protein
MFSLSSISVHRTARSLLEQADGTRLGAAKTAFTHRAQIATCTSPPLHRPIDAPNHLTDLGIRVSSDPFVFLTAATETLGLDRMTAPWTNQEAVLRAWFDDELTEPEIVSHLDALVSFAGRWGDAGEIASQLVTGSRPMRTTRLQTYVACALAARHDARCLQAFDDVATRSDACPLDEAMARVRAAAWLVKRVDDVRGAGHRLVRLQALIDAWRRHAVISEADADTLEGVAKNLLALVDLRAGRPGAARENLQQAISLLGEGDLVTVAPDRRARYAAQARLNGIQLLASTSGWVVASARALEHVEWCRAHHDGSVSEAMAVAAYALFRAGDLVRADRLARQAALVIAREGSPMRLSAVRKTLIGTLHAAGREDEALGLVQDLTADPLGLCLDDHEVDA